LCDDGRDGRGPDSVDIERQMTIAGLLSFPIFWLLFLKKVTDKLSLNNLIFSLLLLTCLPAGRLP
jgi:hypothetical protein